MPQITWFLALFVSHPLPSVTSLSLTLSRQSLLSHTPSLCRVLGIALDCQSNTSLSLSLPPTHPISLKPSSPFPLLIPLLLPTPPEAYKPQNIDRILIRYSRDAVLPSPPPPNPPPPPLLSMCSCNGSGPWRPIPLGDRQIGVVTAVLLVRFHGLYVWHSKNYPYDLIISVVYV